MKKKEIGGFIEFELNSKLEYHDRAIKLNSGRHCLQYILKRKKYRKIFLPYYVCDTLMEPIIKEKVDYEFYNIDENFKPIFNKHVKPNECFLYINYYGLNKKNVSEIANTFNNLIIDNTQAFFEKPIKNIDTIYSPRKFFGVTDGGYLYTDKTISIELKDDISYDRYKYLMKRIELSANESYDLFKKNEEMFSSEEIKNMSKLTQKILSTIDYEKVRNKRNQNFLFLHDALDMHNKLKLNPNDLNGPMVYPFLTERVDIREKLIKNKIYVPTYWEEVKNRLNSSHFEYILADKLIPIPIDQRYDFEDMNYIIEIIKK